MADIKSYTLDELSKESDYELAEIVRVAIINFRKSVSKGYEVNFTHLTQVKDVSVAIAIQIPLDSRPPYNHL